MTLCVASSWRTWGGWGSCCCWRPPPPPPATSASSSTRTRYATAQRAPDPTSDALLSDFLPSSDAEIFVDAHRPSTQVGSKKRAQKKPVRATCSDWASTFCMLTVAGWAHAAFPACIYIPTNIGIVRCTVSVATVVVVSAGVDIGVAIRFLYHLYGVGTPAQVLE